ncbi:hypothetical protein BOTBODRAFT_33755 [Botryobasidium botryosum FD-172 SS1]|uniref:Uncharacterized protein n=1 Tax=Botryobasidium botryosum (strain FD-172 SS1) TaxID=930990 RepID=A0A067MC45_BOTB1|nr:hypothetical protein BOTBODRAFT_33755 [Botryobasidium botryosum FD-172 SS1]
MRHRLIPHTESTQLTRLPPMNMNAAHVAPPVVTTTGLPKKPRCVAFLRFLCTILVFVPLPFLAVHFIFTHQAMSVGPLIRAQCSPASTVPTPFRIAYTGLRRLDARLCHLVSVFDGALSTPAAYRYTLNWLTSFLVPAVIPLLEASKCDVPWAMAFPAVFGMAYQFNSAGACFPVYWILHFAFTYVNFGRRKGTRVSGGGLSQSGVESILFGFIAGYVFPTVELFRRPGSPRVIAAWQFFPVYVSLAQFAYSSVRARWGNARLDQERSGYTLAQTMLFMGFILSAASHVSTLASALYSPRDSIASTLAYLYVPQLQPTLPPNVTITMGSLHLLRWDGVFVWLPTMMAGVLSLEDTQSFWISVLLLPYATLLFGPGAAVAGLWMWREKVLEDRGRRAAADNDDILNEKPRIVL